MTTADWIQAGSLIILLGTLVAVFRQLRLTSGDLRLSANTYRYQAYKELMQPLSQDEIDIVLLHLPDHIKPELFRTSYDRHPERLKSYILMKKKYVHLCFSYDIEK